ncbi:MAG: hypothetical protein U9Q38_01775 [Thermodesulfobacteriota bacterium]|nr:hypothetical protein [Thermodesulfobacteriota bacterium]
MCGYCIEGGVVLPFIESEHKNEQLENNFIANCLQESDNLIGFINKTRELDDFKESIDIVFCRLYEQYITHGFYFPLFGKISLAFDSEVINSFFTERKEFCNEELWKELGNKHIYKDECRWNEFIHDKEYIVKSCLDILNSYYDWWVSGNNKETSDPDQRLEETGIMDPIKNTAPNDWRKFYSIFPVLYFSLSFLSKYRSESEIIKKIALNCPHDVPDFTGNDLWLQRKAFLSCVKKYGLEFILDNLNKIRFELIYYILLKTDMKLIDLSRLRKVVLSENNRFTFGMESEQEIKLIDSITSLSQNRMRPNRLIKLWRF